MSIADEPCRAEVVRAQPLGLRNLAGEDMYSFLLALSGDGGPRREVRVGAAVPAAARSLLLPGTTLPARRNAPGDRAELTIDWAAALAEGAEHV